MKVLNIGSLNIDLVNRVDHIVRPGETAPVLSFARFAGGKGLNQSVALARAGAGVIHAGAIGTDGLFLRELLESEGVDCSGVAVLRDTPTGCALIQVAKDGENAIHVVGGAFRRAVGICHCYDLPGGGGNPPDPAGVQPVFRYPAPETGHLESINRQE